MKIRLYWSAVLLFAITHLNAQESYSKKPLFKTQTIKTQNNNFQLELDVQNIFRGGNNTTFILKRKLSKGSIKNNKKINFLRFQVSGEARNSSEKEGNLQNQNIERNSNSLRINTGLGIEKQIRHNNFVHYYGIDAMFGFSNSKNKLVNVSEENTTSQITNTSEGISRSYSAGFNPFVGIKYYFNPRLSIGVETGIEFLFGRRYGDSKRTRVFVENGVEVFNDLRNDEKKRNSFLSSFNNLRFLTIGYTF